MNPTMSPSLSKPHLFSSGFIHPGHSRPRLPISVKAMGKRHSYRISSIRCVADDKATGTPATTATSNTGSNVTAIFGGKRELAGLQSLVDSLSPPVRIASSVLVVAGAMAAGYGLGSKFGGSKNVAMGAAVAFGAAGGAAAYALNSCVPEVAAINLHNYVAQCDDPTSLNKDSIEAIAAKHGVSKQDEAFNRELCDLYLRFVSSVLPPANEDLTGNEVETIIKFKNALGIDDPDAASMHIEIARRIFRERLETGDRDANIEQRRAFQKLVYVSTLVFGDASAFLLPWKRVFKVTDAQVEVAIRDNAQRLYAQKLNSIGRDFDPKQLADLRKAQILYRLSDELAEEMFRDRTRKLVEENISRGLDILKTRTRSGGIAEVVEELNKVLAFNSLLLSLKNHPDVGSFACGIGPVSLVGGEYDSDRRIDGLKLLYRAYVSESFSSGRLADDKVAALNQLKNIFGLGKRESEAIMMDVASKVYRRLLAKAFSAGDLKAAESKAAFLQNLCDQLRFDPQKANEVHEEIYRKKLQQCLAYGELNEKDVIALKQLRVMLCIPQETVEAAHADICGSMFEKVVREAIASGVDGYDEDTRKSVRKAAQSLRLSREAAMSIASKAVRRIFMSYIKQARAAGSRTESAKILQKMILFNTIVVTELVADIKGESIVTTTEELVKGEEEQPENGKEWESLETLRKTSSPEELQGIIGKPVQTEITVKDDLPERERADLYKTYLLYCITGEVPKFGFGSLIPTQRDDTEYIYLNRLGKILGLSRKMIVEVHKSVAEQTFRQKAEGILADGQLTKARLEQLDEVQKEVGLPPEYAQKVRESIINSKMAGSIEIAIGQGRLSIKQIRELKEASANIKNMISERLRESLLKKTVDEIFSSGTGDFDDEEVYEKIPADLSINAEKARGIVHELARRRLASSLVQAVALLRQRNHAAVVSTLNDLLACDKAVTAEPLSWDVPEELVDLFAIYMKSDPVPEKFSRLQYLLGISDSELAALKERGDQVTDAGDGEEEFVF